MIIEKVLRQEEFAKWCQEFSKTLSSKSLVLLSGDLGAGKTFFVQQMLQALGGEIVSSPSYSLINHYKISKNLEAYHVDLYRLEDDEDLESTGFWDLFEKEQSMMFVEWANRLNKADLPLHWNQIFVEIKKLEDPKLRFYRVLF